MGGGGGGRFAGGGAGFLSTQYPRDVGIAADPRVLFASDFENGSGGWTRYTNNADQISVITDATLAHAGSKYLRAQVTRTQLAADQVTSPPTRSSTSRPASPRLLGAFTPASSARPPRRTTGCASAPGRPATGRMGSPTPSRPGTRASWFDLDASQRDLRVLCVLVQMRSGRCNEAARSGVARAIRAPPTITATTSTRRARRRSRRTPGSGVENPREGRHGRPVRRRADAVEGRRARRRVPSPAPARPLAARQLRQLGPVLHRRAGLRGIRLPLRRRRAPQAGHARRLLPIRHPARLRAGSAGDRSTTTWSWPTSRHRLSCPLGVRSAHGEAGGALARRARRGGLRRQPTAETRR